MPQGPQARTIFKYADGDTQSSSVSVQATPKKVQLLGIVAQNLSMILRRFSSSGPRSTYSIFVAHGENVSLIRYGGFKTLTFSFKSSKSLDTDMAGA